MDSWFPRTRMLRGKFSSRYASTTRIEIRVNLRKSIKLLDLRSIPPKDRQCPTGLVRLLRHFLRRYGSQTGRMIRKRPSAIHLQIRQRRRDYAISNTSSNWGHARRNAKGSHRTEALPYTDAQEASDQAPS